jgi:group I intron endonuclease
VKIVNHIKADRVFTKPTNAASTTMQSQSNQSPSGEIYCIINKQNGKRYVGQVHKYVKAINEKKGTQGRWKEHQYDAFTRFKEGPLYDDIRNMGVDSFEVFKICDCTEEELDTLEDQYIHTFDTLSPKGYNMKHGGSKGKFLEETKKRMSEMQFGNRRDKKFRVHEEDESLPKYIISKRENGVLVGYTVTGFPIGLNKRDYIVNKSFYNKSNPNNALTIAIAYLDNLKREYAHVLEAIQEKRNATHAHRQYYVPPDAPAPIPKLSLPDFTYELPNGFYVDGLIDFRNIPIPRRDFVNESTLIGNLQSAQKFIEQVNILNANNVIVEDWNIVDLNIRRSKNQADGFYLPRYLTVRKYKGAVVGFYIQGLPLKDADGKIYKYSKHIGDKTMSIEAKYKLAIQHLNEMIAMQRSDENTEITPSS